MDTKERSRAIQLLEQEFGPKWNQIVQELGTENLRRRVGKELTSFMAFPERGQGGDRRWRGNCSPEVVRSLLRYALDCKHYNGKQVQNFTLLDPMSGSGTSYAAAESLGVRSILYDLNPTPAYGCGGWNALRDEVDESADLIFLHPPYHDIIPYSGAVWGKAHKDDLSRCSCYAEFIDKLNYVVKKLFLSLRRDGRLAILVGDVRSKGRFYSIQQDMIRLGQPEAFIVKGQFNCASDTRTYKKPFIPVVTEYLLLYHKPESMLIPFSIRREAVVDLRETDTPVLTWHHLIRLTMEDLGGRAKLSDLGDLLAQHPKAKKNPHFRDRIRATVYEHPKQYISCGNGVYTLNYAVA
ncbi:MAG: SAM-dependent methyltransferase [Oscillospiraceae bacterium]|nr:SAM-dependent methyltransferase [Oscillospiraceae bacterium]